MNQVPISSQTDLAPAADFGKPPGGLRRQLYTLIFEADTTAGHRFDLYLIAVILLSILVVMLESVQTIRARHGALLDVLEWTFTILFTVEYLLRLYCVQRPLRYATSFFGIIDLLSILPTYLALFVPEVHALLDVRILRLIRIFRVFKLTLYVAEYQVLMQALRASRRKIMVFLSVVLMIVLLLGTVMYVIEGPEFGFTSIPTAMYWAVVTMTTVGYGDITPHTDVGKVIASAMMLLGWGILAVPTGIVTAEMTSQRLQRRNPRRHATRNSEHNPPDHNPRRVCASCNSEGHGPEAKFCKDCGAALPAP
jgi:voltage-gated potassium channel